MIPEILKQKLINNYGIDDVNDIIESYQNKKIVSLRINTLKTTKENIISILKENNIAYKEISWSSAALIIPNNTEEDLKKLSIYEDGLIYPQANETVLDMAAAPGGKTTEIAALTNNKAMITAIEKNKIRAQRLQYNIDKLGAKKITILNKDARYLDQFFIFDKILLDAPCTGSGTLNLETMNNFNEELLNRSLNTQKSLLTEAIKHLKVGGELIYSTCSILKEENEKHILSLLKEHQNIILVPLTLKDTTLELLPSTIEGVLTIKPNKYYEGFFIAKIKKIN